MSSFAAAAAPIPLYNIYRAEDGCSTPGIAIAIATYSVGTIVGLLVLGRLSNHIGRRPTAIASLAIGPWHKWVCRSAVWLINQRDDEEEACEAHGQSAAATPL